MQGFQQLLFPPFRVDLSTERLWQGEREIPLRPKTFAVLRYLLEQREQSVTIAALLQAVWPDVIVSEAVPRMCIRELRRVLGMMPRIRGLLRPIRGGDIGGSLRSPLLRPLLIPGCWSLVCRARHDNLSWSGVRHNWRSCTAG